MFLCSKQYSLSYMLPEETVRYAIQCNPDRWYRARNRCARESRCRRCCRRGYRVTPIGVTPVAVALTASSRNLELCSNAESVSTTGRYSPARSRRRATAGARCSTCRNLTSSYITIQVLAQFGRYFLVISPAIVVCHGPPTLGGSRHANTRRRVPRENHNRWCVPWQACALLMIVPCE